MLIIPQFSDFLKSVCFCYGIRISWWHLAFCDWCSTIHCQSKKVNTGFLPENGAHYVLGTGWLRKLENFLFKWTLCCQIRRTFLWRLQLIKCSSSPWLPPTRTYHQVVKSVIERLNSDDASAIEAAKTLFSNSEIEGQVIFIKANFSLLIYGIIRLQEESVGLESSLALV